MIDGIVQEDVDAYHPGFGKLYKWLLSAYNGRKSDITRRKALTKKAREDREAKIKASEDRTQARATCLEDADAKFKEDNREGIEAFEKY